MENYCKIKICRPSEFITQLDENIHVSKYKPKRLIGTNINSKRVTSENMDFFIEKFLKPNERKNHFQRVIRNALSLPNQFELITISKNDQILAFIIFDRSEKSKLSIPIFRFLNNSLKITLSKHLLFKAILASTNENRSLIIVSEPYLDEEVLNSIKEARFFKEGENWKKINLKGIVQSHEICDLIPIEYYDKIINILELEKDEENYSFHENYTLERHLSPIKIKNFDIPNYIIPIKPVWAEQLFDDRSSEKLHLFESKNELLLNRENVYYRFSSMRSLSAPARILWYISENPVTKEKGQIKAVSYIDEIFIDDAKKLFRQFEQLGIYRWRDIVKTTDKNNKIMAFIFSDTELFSTPVHLKFLRDLFEKVEDKQFMILSPIKILLISVKPEFAEKIMNGEKTIELRKSAPRKVNKESHILLYVTSPIKELWGICKINNILKDEPKAFWDNYGYKTGITETQFKQYYKTSRIAFGIELKEIRNFSKYSIELKQLKKAFPNFMPPQTYSYIHSEEINFGVLKQILKKIEDRPAAKN